MKRYEIQMVQLGDPGSAWERFRPAKECRTLKGARTEWWYWANRPWEDRPMFRIWDRKKKEVVH